MAAVGGAAAVGARTRDGGCGGALGQHPGRHADDPRAGGVCQAVVGDEGSAGYGAAGGAQPVCDQLCADGVHRSAAGVGRQPGADAGRAAPLVLERVLAGGGHHDQAAGTAVCAAGGGMCALCARPKACRQPALAGGHSGRRAADSVLGQPAVGGGAFAVGPGGCQRRRRDAAGASSVARAGGELAGAGLVSAGRRRGHGARTPCCSCWRRQSRGGTGSHGEVGCRRLY